MARACKFCHYLNSYVCEDEFEGCIDCGRCRTQPAGTAEKETTS